MKIEKLVLGEMYRAYSTGSVRIDGELHAIIASEAIDGMCLAYHGENFDQTKVVWEKAGGTMSIVPIPDTNGEFLAVQNFFPGFNGLTSKVVHVVPKGDGFEVRDFIDLPYLHRFDIITRNGVNYFLGAALCTSKTDREDWSDPGKVYVGILPSDLSKGMEVKPIYENLTHNHGYYQATYEGKPAGYVTSDEGVFVFVPPFNKKEVWEVHHIIKKRVSDVAVFDIDGDGEDEILSIEPFHGKEMHIYKKINNQYEIVYTVDRPIEFAHAICGTTLRGKPVFVCGIRRLSAELFYIEYHKETNSFECVVIDENIGTANIVVVNEEDRDIIVAANNTIHQAALYIIK
ncbi:MAG: hypothetical protein JXC31_02315 [Acholeplasmataceae bacterium]|nr:hypothetical protein [Acholeplasmataceae bacterium]